MFPAPRAAVRASKARRRSYDPAENLRRTRAGVEAGFSERSRATEPSMRLCFRPRRRHVLAACIAGLPSGPAAGRGRAGDANLVAGRKRIRGAVDQPVRGRQPLQDFDLGTEVASDRDWLELDLVVRTDRGDFHAALAEYKRTRWD